MAGSSNIVLYSFWRSSCAWRVRIALNLKQIPYELKTVDLLKAENHVEEVKKLNPMKRVPCLLIDDTCLTDSMNIIYYLEETRENFSLLPTDPKMRAQVREICYIISSGIQPLQNLSVLNRLNENERLSWAQYWIQYGFTALEELLSKRSGKYCFGDAITLADCCLEPQVGNAERFCVPMEKFPIITRISNELNKHPAFIKASPFEQPDCPSKVV